jgi:hypothetical protein
MEEHVLSEAKEKALCRLCPDRRGQISNRRPLSERPLQIEARKRVGHSECYTVIGSNLTTAKSLQAMPILINNFIARLS